MPRRRRPLWRRYWRFLRDVVVQTWQDDLPLLAAALAHFALLSLIPLLLLVLWVLGTVYKGTDPQQVIELIAPMFPRLRTDVVGNTFLALVDKRGAAGGLGVLVLLWIALRIFVTLQAALDRIWEVKHQHRRPLLLQYLIAVPTVILIGLVAWVSAFLTPFVAGILPLLWPTWAEEALPTTVALATDALSVLVSVLLMFCIYRLLPTYRPRTRSALYGAVVAGVAWEASKRLFTWYIAAYAKTDQVYGAMGGIVILMFWTYLSALILLFGAEVVSCHAKRIAERPVLEAEDRAAPPSEPAEEPEPTAERLAPTGEAT